MFAATALEIRRMRPSDADACGRVAFEAHQHVAGLHHMTPEHPTVEFSIGMFAVKLKDPRAIGWVAERDGQVAGSVFLNIFTPTVAAIGPMTVHPHYEGGAGRALIETALAHAATAGIAGVRLVQSPSHLRSLALYAKAGFEAREPLVLVQGSVPPECDSGALIRPATSDDVDACHAIADRVTGVIRDSELRQAVERGTAAVAVRGARICGYTTGTGFTGHAAAVADDDLIALLCAAPKVPGPGFLLPIRNSALLRWALTSGLRMGWPALLMTRGPYREPEGAFVPSIAF